MIVAYGLDHPIGIFGQAAINEASLHTRTHTRIVGGTEEHLARFFGVIGIEIVCAFGHVSRSFHDVTHRFVADNGLRSPRLTFGKIAACSDIIDIDKSIGLHGRERRSWHGTVFANDAKLLPLVGLGKECLTSLLNSEDSRGKRHATEHVGTQGDIGWIAIVHAEGSQLGSTRKGAVAKALHTGRQIHLGDGSTILEGAVFDSCQPFGQRHSCKHLTAIEGLLANRSNRFRQGECRQRTTTAESTCTDALDALWQRDIGQRRAITKSIVGNGGETGELAQLLEIPDRLPLEHGAQVFHLGGLTIAELAIAIGVPIGYAEHPHTRVAEVDRHVGEVLRFHADNGLDTRVIAIAASANAL